jgi:HPr kinase/phosphorylase
VTPAAETLHASCVAVDGKGLLILGPSGSGKSSLALQMIAFGARLVADDQVALSRRGVALVARCPAPLAGVIEARGLGLLRCEPLPETEITLVADLGTPETARLPEKHEIVLLGCKRDLVRLPSNAHFPAALLVYLRGGRVA